VLTPNTALSSSCKDFTSRAGEKLELLSRNPDLWFSRCRYRSD